MAEDLLAVALQLSYLSVAEAEKLTQIVIVINLESIQGSRLMAVPQDLIGYDGLKHPLWLVREH